MTNINLSIKLQDDEGHCLNMDCIPEVSEPNRGIAIKGGVQLLMDFLRHINISKLEESLVKSNNDANLDHNGHLNNYICVKTKNDLK